MQSFRINLLHYELYSLWFPQEMSTSSGMGSFVGCSVDMCFSVILSTGLQGNLCFDAWNTSLLLFFSDLGVHKVASPTFFFLSPPFLSFLKYLLTEDHPAWLISSAVCCGGALQLAGTLCVEQRTGPGLFSHKTPCSTGHKHPMTQKHSLTLNYLDLPKEEDNSVDLIL